MPKKSPILTKQRGFFDIIYRDINGKSQDARIIASGSVSGAKLFLTSFQGTGKVRDNVALGTGLKQTNVYFYVMQ